MASASAPALGSCPDWNTILTSFDDELWYESISQINLLLSKLHWSFNLYIVLDSIINDLKSRDVCRLYASSKQLYVNDLNIFEFWFPAGRVQYSVDAWDESMIVLQGLLKNFKFAI